jgi:dihydrolipoamide dehydrogenase
VDRATLDYKIVQARSRQVVKTLTAGVSGLLKKNKVDYLAGTASITGEGSVAVESNGVAKQLRGHNVLLATGSRPMSVPGFEFDEQCVLSSTGILSMTELPKSMIILGAGAIGCEFAYVLNSFGVEVTLVEAMEHILPTEDFETTEVLAKSFQRAGIDLHVNTRATKLEHRENGISVSLDSRSGDKLTVEADKALVVFGRVPNTQNLGLEELGINLTERGYLETQDYGQTKLTWLYAIGDITTTPALAHVASKEGEIAVEHMAGHSTRARIDVSSVPSAIYCEPQLAGFGLREQEAKASGINVKTSVFNYAGAGKTIAVGKSEGLVKILCDSTTDEIVGAHVVGHNATELIHELLLAKHSELLPEDVESMIHAHPTISEAIMETMRGINGKPIHA